MCTDPIDKIRKGSNIGEGVILLLALCAKYVCLPVLCVYRLHRLEIGMNEDGLVADDRDRTKQGPITILSNFHKLQRSLNCHLLVLQSSAWLAQNRGRTESKVGQTLDLRDEHFKTHLKISVLAIAVSFSFETW